MLTWGQGSECFGCFAGSLDLMVGLSDKVIQLYTKQFLPHGPDAHSRLVQAAKRRDSVYTT